MSESRRGVQSIDRAVAILRCFTAREPEIGISELSRRTGLSVSTTHRLLAAMQDNRLVRQAVDRRYALGPLLVQLARSGAVPTTLRDAAFPLMRRLCDEVDETVGLHALLPTYERTVVDQVESHQPLRRTYTEFGVPIALTLGAPGKALLAYLPRDRQESILAQPIPHVTAATVTDPDALRAELAEVRARGFAVSLAERIAGIRTVAAPIFERADGAVGAMSVSAPEARMPHDLIDDLGTRLAATAWTVSELLGATRDGLDGLGEA